MTHTASSPSPKLSFAHLIVLSDAAKPGGRFTEADHLVSEALADLRRNGLLSGDSITDAGREALRNAGWAR